MSNKELAELLKFSSPNIIYVVNWQNRLMKLHTPFKLLVLQDIGGLFQGQIVECTEIKVTYEGKMVFCVEGKLYHTIYFDILAI